MCVRGCGNDLRCGLGLLGRLLRFSWFLYEYSESVQSGTAIDCNRVACPESDEVRQLRGSKIRTRRYWRLSQREEDLGAPLTRKTLNVQILVLPGKKNDPVIG